MADSIHIPVKINDLLKVDGDLTGRVINISRQLNTYNIYVVQTKIGKLQIPRIRLRVIREIVASVTSHINSAFNLPDEVDDLLKDDVI